MVSLIYILVYLGLWQIDRAKIKKNLQKEAQRATLQSTQPLIELLDGDVPRFAKVTVTGYQQEKAVFLDNYVRRGKKGFRLLVPIASSQLAGYLLLDYGWVADTTYLPEAKMVAVEGVVNQLPKPLLLQKESVSTPLVLQRIDYPLLEEYLHGMVYRFIVQVNEAPIINVSPERHIAYAIQWFGLAIVGVVYLMGLIMRRW